MNFSATEASKKVGKSIPTITRAIKNGKLTAKPRAGGGWIIEASELFRVWPSVTNSSNVTVKMLESETPIKNNVLEREVELLREMLDETKTDRDHWRKQANQLAITNSELPRKKFLGVF